MAVAPQPQQHQVKAGQRPTKKVFHLAPVGTGCCLRRQFAADAVHVLGRDGHVGDQGLVGHVVVAGRILRRHTALVAPEQVHPIPGDLALIRLAGQQPVGALGRRTAAEGHAETAARCHRLPCLLKKAAGRFLGQRRGVGQHDHLPVQPFSLNDDAHRFPPLVLVAYVPGVRWPQRRIHLRTSCRTRSSASAGPQLPCG